MSNERNGQGVDPLVSETYRELADEKAPEALNREILRLAAKEARTPFATARAWTRPLAWAATVALSLGLVLHLTETPVAPESRSPTMMDEDRMTAEEKPAVEKRSRADMQPQAAKVEVVNDAPAAAGSVSNDAADSLDAGSPLAEPAAPAGRRESAEEAASPVAEKQFEVESKFRRAERRRAEQPVAGISALSSLSAEADEEGLLCPPAARESAETWLACIASIEDTTPDELIEREYEALRSSFPAFDLPPRQ